MSALVSRVTCHTLGHSITATVTTKSSSVQQVSASVYSISKSGVTRHQLIAAMLGAGPSAADKCAQALQLWPSAATGKLVLADHRL